MSSFALVRWSSGAESGTYTVIEATWIVDLDNAAFDNVSAPPQFAMYIAMTETLNVLMWPEKPCVVEWRVTADKKKPSSWLTYDAFLIKTSDKRDVLQKQLKILEREMLSEVPADEKRNAEKPRRFESIENVDLTTNVVSDAKESKKLLLKATSKRSGELMKKLGQPELKKPAQSENRPEEETLLKLQTRINELEAENKDLKDMLYQAMPKLMVNMAEVLHQKKDQHTPAAGISTFAPLRVQTSLASPIICQSVSAGSTSTSNHSSPNLFFPSSPPPPPSPSMRSLEAASSMPAPQEPRMLSEPDSVESDKVCLFNGSTVMVNRSVLISAQQATSPTSMIRTLLLGAFPIATLLHSNLKGGKSTRPGESENQQPLHTKLDETVIRDLYALCMIKFPGTSKGVLGVAVNGKLTELRNRLKQGHQSSSNLAAIIN